MYPHSPLWHYLWIAPHVMQVLIVFVMIRRRLIAEFPLFLIYTITEAVGGGILFSMDHIASVSPQEYWATHRLLLAISVALRFAVIYEIFSNLFRPYEALARLSQVLLRWTAAVLLIVAVIVAAYATPGPEPTLLFSIHVVEVAVSVMQCGLLLFLFMFSSYFRVSWKSYLFGIAAGFGLCSIITLAKESISITTGPAPASYFLDFVTLAAYHCSVLIWLVYMLLPQAQGRTASRLPTHDLEQWNQELQRLLLQ
jgi:hypothetical protein